MPVRHKILLLTTGGTISGHVADHLIPNSVKNPEEKIGKLLLPTIEFLNAQYNYELEVDYIELFDLDSSDINDHHWNILSNSIKDHYDSYDSFLITHGTNTLAYTSAALSFAFPNINKSVILTGSQVSVGMPGSDSLINLNNAIRLAAWPYVASSIKGVVVVFGTQIIPGTRVKKDNDFDYDAFKPHRTENLGRIGRVVNLYPEKIRKHNSYLQSGMHSHATSSNLLLCENSFDMRIASITEFPGMTSDYFKTLVEECDTRGFILRAFGTGDASTKHVSTFEYLKLKEIPIVITTQMPNGISNFQVNKPGQIIREGNLAIPAFDMSVESQTTKLAWLLAKKDRGELNYDQLCSVMLKDIRGEINANGEIGI